ncbi:MAG TPA: ATP-binding protein [Bdellovibrionota bacterium]|nr:ATP-binding protein [Bdellovibrionota bacterium]
MVKRDLDEKLVLLSGPRQVGKTTLSKNLHPASTQYFSFDEGEDRRVILKKAWSPEGDLVVLDELHKMPKWKSWLKGVYDTRGNRPRILVTGSARLDIYRKGGDSLAGRYFYHRLHPFSVSEVKREISPEEALDRLMRFGGFPEPFLKASDRTAKRWRRSHLDRILREDLIDLEQIRNIKLLELLVDLLATRVGKTVSYKSLSEDLQVSPHTVKNWIRVLEQMLVIFIVTPFSKNIARAIQKEPKIYFYDTGRLLQDEGARFENIVACALLKRNHYLEDTEGDRRELHYIRDREKREVDFLTVIENRPEWLIEAKTSETGPTSALRYYTGRIPGVKASQVVKNLSRKLYDDPVSIEPAAAWLAQLDA